MFHRHLVVSTIFLPLVIGVLFHAEPPQNAVKKETESKVAAIVESTLATGGKQIRQFAFDGDTETYFASMNNPKTSDHFTLIIDKPVAVKSLHVITGKPKGGDALDAGVLQVSGDGHSFEEVAKFKDGKAGGKLDGKKIQSIRVRATEEMTHPLAIREFVVESDPAITIFKYPVEIFVDVSAAVEMKGWAENVARVCERQYPIICEELTSVGFTPRSIINLKMDPNYNGVAEAGGGNIRGSVKYFKANEKDVVLSYMKLSTAFRATEDAAIQAGSLRGSLITFDFSNSSLAHYENSNQSRPSSTAATGLRLNSWSLYPPNMTRKL